MPFYIIKVQFNDTTNYVPQNLTAPCTNYTTVSNKYIALYFNTISIIISLPIQVTKAAEDELQGRKNKKTF